MPAPSAQTLDEKIEAEKRSQAELDRLKAELDATKGKRDAMELKRATITDEIDGLRRQLIAKGRASRDHETTIANLRETLSDMEHDAAAKRARLVGRRYQLGRLLQALERLAMNPPEAMLALPQSPRQTVDGAILLTATLPSISHDVADLKRQLEALARIESDMAEQRAMVTAAVGRLLEERRSLDELMAKKEALEQSLGGDVDRAQHRIEALGAQARDVKDLLDRLIADRRAEEARKAEEARLAEEKRRAEAAANADAPAPSDAPTQSASIPLLPNRGLAAVAPPGARTLPAAGRVIRGFGDADEIGAPSRGITIATQSEARLVAPFTGRVLFAGAFRGYGQILIIEHADGYVSLVAGFGRVDATVGQTVAAGEPVGSAPPSGPPSGTDPASPPRDPTIYFELRRYGQPTNPQPWLAVAQRGK